MKDDNGKIILSLLAGATAGVVAGLLLAPNDGTSTRAGLRKSASKWTDDLGGLLQAGLNQISALRTTAAGASTEPSADRSAADDLLTSMSISPDEDEDTPAAAPRKPRTPKASVGSASGSFADSPSLSSDADTDYDGIGNEPRPII